MGFNSGFKGLIRIIGVILYTELTLCAIAEGDTKAIYKE